jgi:uncharacterized protein YhfF
MSENIKSFWEAYLKTIPANSPPQIYTAWSFGNTPEMKNELALLVLNGPKRATTSLKWIYEKFPEEKMPEVGEFSIVLNSTDQPVCIIQTVHVEERRFCDIDEDYAFTEGEGDRSLKYWQEAHWDFFSKECELVQRAPSMDMPVICEIFKVVYPTGKANQK